VLFVFLRLDKRCGLKKYSVKAPAHRDENFCGIEPRPHGIVHEAMQAVSF
jgi:hypothetical protein